MMEMYILQKHEKLFCILQLYVSFWFTFRFCNSVVLIIWLGFGIKNTLLRLEKDQVLVNLGLSPETQLEMFQLSL